MAGAVTGDFATVDIRGLAPGAQFDVTQVGGAYAAAATNDAVALPTVSVKAASKKLKEKAKKGAFKFTRTGDVSEPLTVSYALGGTAENGLDYVALPGSVTFPAKKKAAKVTVQPVNDFLHEDTESLELTVVPGPQHTNSLTSKAQIAIVDDD